MSEIDYQALREKAEKATCGEWSLEYGEGRFDGDDALIHREAAGYIPICRIEGAHPESGFDEDFQMEQQANAEFIAAANPATVLALLDERERNQQYIKRRDQENEDIALTVGKLRVELEGKDRRITELTMWIKRLSSSLKNAKPDSKLPDDAMIWLNNEGLTSIESARDEMPFGLDNDQAHMLTAFKIALASLERERVRHEHAKWSDSTFGCVGPIGPLKHLSKEALEAAAEPDDLSEWADMQFLLWDAQRRAGISDAEITAAMENKLKINMERQWPEPKDGEPRLHIKEPGNSPVTPDGWISCSERMPDTKTAVLVAVEFDRKGDWRMKWATYIPGHPDANDGWIIPGASWKPSHWMPLPEPPQEVK
ncbi:TPA: DUF550 domain-containing protein [Escherichia coli]|nr:DUF550 domain-containing protein [Escherichia coli]